MGRSIERHWQRAQAFVAQGMAAPAHAELEIMQVQAPGDVRTHLLAAAIAWREKHIRLTAREALAAAGVVPDDPPLLLHTIDLLLRAGEGVAARVCLGRPALAEVTRPDWLLRMADFRQQLNEHTESLALLERALAHGAIDAETQYHHGAQLYFHGRMEEAAAALEASLAVEPAHGQAAFTLSALRTQTRDHNHLVQLANGLRAVAPGSIAHAALQFARYKELEDVGRDEDAWAALAAGNAIMHARKPFGARLMAYPARMAEASAHLVARAPATSDAGPQPIFVMGFPRSGTTLLDRMLGSHGDVRSAGELPDFPAQVRWSVDTRDVSSARYFEGIRQLDAALLGRRYLAQTQWHAAGKRFYIDKFPPNWQLAGLIHAALPGAKLLHLVRAPMDVCFSNWRAFFGDGYRYSYDLATLAAYYRAYRRLMAHWHDLYPGAIMDVAYADLVREPEATLRRVFDFCGLPFQAACVDMRNNPEPVMTLSAGQVRGRVHARALGQWHRYAAHLQPLAGALEQDTVSVA